MTNLPLPSHYYPQLTVDRLSTVARWLLEVQAKVEQDLDDEDDTSYTRGTATFGRQWARIVRMANSREFSWLSLLNSGNDLVFAIGGVPCRFSNDDPENPSKPAVLEMHPEQHAFAEMLGTDTPSRFCFIASRGSDIEEPRVVLVGLTPSGDVLCRWQSDAATLVYPVSSDLPGAVVLPKPAVTPKAPASRDEATGTDRA